jgi:DNA-binding XRE family transcriptional regulator
MTPQELKEARQMLGLTQTDMGAALGISGKQIYNLEAGKKPIQKQTELAVECLLRRKGLLGEYLQKISE